MANNKVLGPPTSWSRTNISIS